MEDVWFIKKKKLKKEPRDLDTGDAFTIDFLGNIKVKLQSFCTSISLSIK